MSAAPDVAVVIVAYASAATIDRAVASVRDEPRVAEVVVVDNASPDDSATRAEAAGARVVAAPNDGFGAGCNRGAAATTAPYLLFLNPDAAVAPGTVDGLARHLDDHPRTGIAASELREPDGSAEPVARRAPSAWRAVLEPGPAARLDHRHYARSAPAGGPVDWLSGACLLVRRSAFDAAGGFDESFFLYGEDADLALRFAGAGWRADGIPGFVTTHATGTSTAAAADRGKAAWAAGWLRMVERHHPRPALARQGLRVGLAGRVVVWRLLGKPDRARPWQAALKVASRPRSELTSAVLPVRGGRIDLLDVPVDVVSLDDALQRIDSLIEERRFATVATVNLDFLGQGGRDAELRSALRDADLVVADGVPLLWMASWQRTPLLGRVNGTDLTERLLERCGRNGWPVYFLGGEPGVADAAAAAAERRWGTPCAGTAAPPRAEMQDPAAARAIAAAVGASDARVLLLAIGGGHQERWIRRHHEALGATVAIGVGSALDFIAGRQARAPEWMQRRGLEWAWRLAIEPQRLWRRYLVEGPQVLVRFAVRRVRR